MSLTCPCTPSPPSPQGIGQRSKVVSLPTSAIGIILPYSTVDTDLQVFEPPGSFHHPAKKLRKTLIFIVLWFFEFLSSKNDVKKE
jgi:hypothetical protein